MVSDIFKKLYDLDDFIFIMDGDVTTLNWVCVTQMDVLKAWGENSSDIMVNLFKGYFATPERNYEEGQDLTEYDIMRMVENESNMRNL